MELSLKPRNQNSAPLGGLLLGGTSVGDETPDRWLREIQALGLSLPTLTAYALPQPGTTQPWGCLLAVDPARMPTDVGRHACCQLVNGLLFIPEKAVLYPQLSAAELDRLLLSRPHFFHPATGLIELVRPIDWTERLTTPVQHPIQVRKPVPPVRVPEQVRSFQVQAAPPEAVLERMEADAFPKPEVLDTKPLNPFETLKLNLLRQLLGKPGQAEPSPLLPALTRLRNWLTGEKKDWPEQLQTDLAELEKRNQKQLDRLLSLLKENPAEALKYAIPLDENGTARGDNKGLFDFTLRWANFSLFDRPESRSSGGTSVLPENGFERLQHQYRQAAEELIRQREFHKAAFVYLKLLKNYGLAAQTLENGRYYGEAASVWLKYGKDKAKAADCYEKASMTETAIALYEEIGQHEKAGDLYTTLNRPADARLQYQRVIDDLTANGRFVKAALVYRHKLHDAAGGQSLLLTGWQQGKDAYNCLNNYFAAIDEPKELEQALHRIRTTTVDAANRELFLQVLRHEYTRHATLAEPIADMAHELIAAQIPVNPAIVSELRFFGQPDTQLTKDIMRFKTGNQQAR